MTQESEVRNRCAGVRKPRHGWFDYEVIDVFGDNLGPYGITVYTVLARFCYGGFRVTMDLRELAGHARMSKDSVGRTLRKMVASASWSSTKVAPRSPRRATT